MSHTTAALLGRGQFVVAIAGATGRLGDVVTRTFLTQPFSPHFSRVIALTRSASSPKSHSLAEAGAEVVQVTSFEDDNLNAVEELTKALKGVDIVVNVLGGAASLKAKDNVAKAAVDAGAVVYFPSEFGVDHRQNDFADFESPEWIKKKDHVRYVQEISKGRTNFQITSVYNGLFLELSFGPWFGFDLQATPPNLTSLGPSSTPSSYTSLLDIARSLAQLSILASTSSTSILSTNQDTSTTPTPTIPSHIRIQGSSPSYDTIARTVERIKGLTEGDVKVTSLDLAEERKKLREAVLSGGVATPLTHIRILIAEGHLDFSSSNQNELVNPHGAIWEWKTVEKYLEEILGGEGKAK